MIDVSGLKLSLDAGLPSNHALALNEIARQLGVGPRDIRNAQLLKRSVDARKKANVHFIASYRLEMDSNKEKELIARKAKSDRSLRGIQVVVAKPYQPLFIPRLVAPSLPPIVIGAGPAGLFAAWYLAKCGLRPLLVEQGAPVDERARDVEAFFKTGKLDPWSNIQFGEGGAGTFSDGKLTTNTKNRFTAHVLRWFVDAGAPEDILWQAHPHLGSDNLAHIVRAIREDIERLGGTVRFHTQLVDLAFTDSRLQSLVLRDTKTNKRETLHCSALILACGHSARQTFKTIRDAGLVMEQKPFSMGVRIEHPQQLINQAQWGNAAGHPALGAAEYKLAIHLPSGRSVYSFCMCPGGEVVAAASEVGGIVTNGMSDFARAGENANAAILVNVDPSDFGSEDVLAGIELQRAVEQRAYQASLRAGGSLYQAPAQTLGAFLADRHDSIPQPRDDVHSAMRATREHKDQKHASARCFPTYERGVIEVPLDEVLPSFVAEALREALPLMGKKIRGFDDPAAILTAPETRSSSPVRICRNESLQAFFASQVLSDQAQATGIYPCGEGPGFAGGIMSAAVDGLKVAQEVAMCYQCTSAEDSSKTHSSPVPIDQAIAALRDGKPVVFPTDTVYGVGVAVDFAASPAALYRLKQRPDNKPIAWLIGNKDDLNVYGKNVPKWAEQLAQTFWPGAITLIVRASGAVTRAYQGKDGTIALRMPDSVIARELISAVGPIATTSANLSGEPATVCFADLPKEFAALACMASSGPCGGQASCVIDCTTEKPRIVREGSLDSKELLTQISLEAE